MTQGAVNKMTLGVAWGLIILALTWGAAPFTGAGAVGRMYVDFLAWPYGDGTPVWDAQFTWMSSIGAGLLMGVGVMFLGIIYPAVKRGDAPVIKVAIAGFIGWFIVDSAGSIASGFTMNAVFNVVTLVVMITPLWFALRLKK